LNCPKCGVEAPDEATSCAACGERFEDVSNQAAAVPPGLIKTAPIVYAGFWFRAGAYVIDSLLLGMVVGLLLLRPLMDRAGISPDDPWVLFSGMSRQIVAINLLVTMAGWLYWALLESSAWQATVGKRILGLKVTDLEGRRISFARATGRHFGKVLSGLILFLGFVMAGFTEKKQALHDIFAGCLVFRKI
jgi:uncharacterized RDD family membrane protein YckC